MVDIIVINVIIVILSPKRKNGPNAFLASGPLFDMKMLWMNFRKYGDASQHGQGDEKETSHIVGGVEIV